MDVMREEYKTGWGVRIGLLFLAASALPVGLWALISPRSFHDDFPAAGRHWISALGPYHEHLITDVGAAYLALGVLLTLAGILLGRSLVRVALVSWLVFAVPHFTFHLTTLDVFPLVDNLVNLAVLGIAALLPLLLLAATFGAARGGEPSGDRQVKERTVKP